MEEPNKSGMTTGEMPWSASPEARDYHPYLISCDLFDPPIVGVTWAKSHKEAIRTAVKAGINAGYDVKSKDFSFILKPEWYLSKHKQKGVFLDPEMIAGEFL